MERTRNIMRRKRITYTFISFIIALLTLQGCEEFFNPTQDLVIREDDYFNDWYDYRAAEMGLYALQQDLAEQLLILGELRGDLVQVTENASRDLIEVNNFEITEINKYASPRGFYKLIAACNNLQRILEIYHPNVKDPEAQITNYDKLYGEVVLMRSWAYFNAVRIYREIPYVPPTLTTIEEIEEYVNSPHTILDSMDILYNTDGWHNDTIIHDPPLELSMENAYLTLDQVVDSCATDILRNVKSTGVVHYLDNNDASWEVTGWNEYAMAYLLGQMYLHKGDIHLAQQFFDELLYITEIGSNEIRYGLTRAFQKGSWKNILTSINVNEHIFVIWFGKSNQQTNNFQKYFSVITPNTYELKPTKRAVHYWESIFHDWRYQLDATENPPNQALDPRYDSRPGDFFRGPNVSYAYIKDEMAMDNKEIREMLSLKMDQNDFEVDKMMEGYDTVVYKYTLGKVNDPFAHDANFIMARAAGVHLYATEIYTHYAWNDIGGGNIVPAQGIAEKFLNDGSYDQNANQLGVRGRVGLSDREEEKILILPDILYIHHPFTNEVLDYVDFTGNTVKKQIYFEDRLLEEKARELAFEGERFYDLVRFAERRNRMGLDGNAFLADMVASKFSGAKAEQIRSKLMNDDNWYLPFTLDIQE